MTDSRDRQLTQQEQRAQQELHEKNLDRIRRFCLMDDDFLNAAFAGNNECTQLVLRIILEIDDLTVTEVITQKSVKNIYGRSVRLDIFATDSSGKRYNIEVQRSDYGAGARRARYNSSLMDAEISVSGEDTAELVDTYVIFITQNDVLGRGLPVYHVERVVKETGLNFGDGAHILYVNGSYESDNDIGKLMHDFRCTEPDDMHYKELADVTRYLKKDEGGVRSMCKIMEEAIQEARLEARLEAQIQAKYEFALTLIKMGVLSREKIAEATGLPLEEIELLSQQQGA